VNKNENLTQRFLL